MNNSIKIGLYALFAIGAILSGIFFYKTYQKLNPKQEESAEHPVRAAKKPEKAPAAAPTNAVAAGTNVVSTNAAAGTNAPRIAATNAAPEPVASEPAVEDRAGALTARGRNFAPLFTWVGVFLVMIIGLGLIAAHDVSQYMASRALKVLYNDEGDGMKTPEYDAAEQVWANGDHLEAIRMMREYLKKNPREVHVAIRIAEIYEKDLKNYLAAALEYEEILKSKMQPDRWGWSAIHLCNLYFKLEQNEKAIAWLTRIVTEAEGTPAAEKARAKLEQLQADGLVIIDETPPETPPAQAAAPEPSSSKLPPGFGPRKA